MAKWADFIQHYLLEFLRYNSNCCNRIIKMVALNGKYIVFCNVSCNSFTFYMLALTYFVNVLKPNPLPINLHIEKVLKQYLLSPCSSITLRVLLWCNPMTLF